MALTLRSASGRISFGRRKLLLGLEALMMLTVSIPHIAGGANGGDAEMRLVQ